MKETFTYKEIQDANQAAAQLAMQRAPQKTAYRLAKLITKLRVLGKDIGKEQLELYKKYGKEKTPGTGDWNIPAENQKKFMEEMDPLMEKKVEVEYHPIACDMFDELPANCILGMGKFMVETELIITPGK